MAGSTDRWSPQAFIAGSIAGAAGIFVGHPLDTLKTFAQTGQKRPDSVLSLFRGIRLQALVAGSIQSLHLGVYENLRRVLTPGLGDLDAPLWTHACAGTTGGILVSTLTTPLSRIKVAQQLTGSGFVATVRSIGSVRSLYVGGLCTLVFEASRGGYMVVYECFKTALSSTKAAGREGGGVGEVTLSLGGRVAAGAGANVLVWAVMFPVETVRNVQQGEAAKALVVGSSERQPPQQHLHVPRGAIACACNLVREAGVRRLYRGWLLTVLRAGPVAGVILPCFELVLPILEGTPKGYSPPRDAALLPSVSQRQQYLRRHMTGPS